MGDLGVKGADRTRHVDPRNGSADLAGEPVNRQRGRAGLSGGRFREMLERRRSLEPGQVEQAVCHRVVVGGFEFAAPRLQYDEPLTARAASGRVEDRALAQPWLALDDRRRESG